MPTASGNLAGEEGNPASRQRGFRVILPDALASSREELVSDWLKRIYRCQGRRLYR